MDLIAHRGCADEYPENTVRAVERAARRLPAVELDVRRCRSGELVVFHDATVDRVTDGTGSIARLNWEQLRELEVLGSGERIPLLSEALAAVPSNADVQVELKQAGIAGGAVAAVADAGVDARFTSFRPEALAEVREHDPTAPMGYLFGAAVGVETGLATALALDCRYLHPHSSLCIETDVVERAHAQGLDVIAWAADDAGTVADLRAAGVDGATADSWTLADREREVEAEPMAAD
ncbi:glycerophosphodiester phosphodiesterase [Halobacteriales archaeon QS_1_67_19]|nr:MAG: glycerophosphodiester phosphodiesterase [Halobacteriales archaeon QS_1_67_19]